jgi:hypothetical protein
MKKDRRYEQDSAADATLHSVLDACNAKGKTPNLDFYLFVSSSFWRWLSGRISVGAGRRPEVVGLWSERRMHIQQSGLSSLLADERGAPNHVVLVPEDTRLD